MKSITEFLQTQHAKYSKISPELTGEIIPKGELKKCKKGTYIKETYKYEGEELVIYGIFDKLEKNYNNSGNTCIGLYCCRDGLGRCSGYSVVGIGNTISVMNDEDYMFYIDELDKNKINIPEEYKL